MQFKKKKIRDIINKERSIYERFASYIKDTYFTVIFILLKEEEVSIYTAYGFTIIEFLQLFYFYFHPTNYQIWKAKGLPKNLGTLLGYLHLTTYLQESDWESYQIMFYLLFVFNTILMVAFLYIKFAYDNNYYFNYFIVIVKQFVLLISTVFYLPMINFFAGILYCSSGNLHYFPEVQCWNSMHLFHSFFAVIALISFVYFVLIIIQTYFRIENKQNDPIAKTSGRANFDLQAYKIVLVISFTFFNGSDFQLIVLAIMLGGSVVVFKFFYFNSPYHSDAFAKLYEIFTGINLWTVICLIIAEVAEKSFIDGTVIVYLIGIPFIILFIKSKQDSKIDLLLQNVNKFQTGEELMFQVSYLQKLINGYSFNKNYATILDGYIELHKLKCTKCNDKNKDKKEECVMQDQTQQKNTRILKTIMQNSNQTNVKHAKLIHMIYEMYMNGVKKFPNNTNLRISYSLFLIDNMKYKQQALQELNHAEENSPPFGIYFMIYRLKKIIEEEIQKDKKSIKDHDYQLDIL